MRRIRSFSIFILAIGLLWPVGAASGQTPTGASLTQILTIDELWGDDFQAVLAYLQSWELVGEQEVAVFGDRIVGATPYESLTAAASKSRDLSVEITKAAPIASQTLAPMLEPYRKQAPRFEVEVAISSHDGSQRVAWTAPTIQLLAPGLTMATVRERLGPPEEVTREVIESERDHRPVELTGLSYAGGAAIFVETNIAPRPGYVDHVVLDIPAVAAVLAEEE